MDKNPKPRRQSAGKRIEGGARTDDARNKNGLERATRAHMWIRTDNLLDRAPRQPNGQNRASEGNRSANRRNR
jgi:hypothetical protein